MSGPWIQSVALRERGDGGDEHGTVDGVAGAAGVQLDLDLDIALVRGDWQGTIVLHVQVHDPAGDAVAAVEVDGDPPAIPYAVSRIVVPVELVPTQPGIYWLDVREHDHVLTRVPLRIDW